MGLNLQHFTSTSDNEDCQLSACAACVCKLGGPELSMGCLGVMN